MRKGKREGEGERGARQKLDISAKKISGDPCETTAEETSFYCVSYGRTVNEVVDYTSCK